MRAMQHSHPHRRSPLSWADGLGLACSGVCLVHCLAFPLLWLLLPLVHDEHDGHSLTHLALFLVVLPVAALALISGFRHHRRREPLVLGMFGIVLLASGIHPALSLLTQTVLSVMGASAMAIAHLLNLRIRSQLDCCAPGA